MDTLPSQQPVEAARELKMSKKDLSKSSLDLHRIVTVMAGRLTHPTGAALLRSRGIAVGRSWKETTLKVAQVDGNTEIAQKAARLALNALDVNALVGNKRVSWYDYGGMHHASQATFNEWLDRVVQNPPVDEEWTTKFPYPLTPIAQSDLKAFDQNEPKLVKVWAHGQSVFFQFFSVRTHNERDELSGDIIREDAPEAVKSYTQIIGVREQFLPCFDTVVVRRDQKRIEMRVDIPPAAIPNDIQARAASVILQTFNSISYSASGVSTVGLYALDLFPLLLPLYRDAAAGKITSLGFVAFGKDSASKNTGKPVRRRGHDLRQDEFHKSGAAKVEVRPYSIGVSWDAVGRAEEIIELDVPGTIHSLYKALPLTVASLLGCASFDDYDFLLERIEHYSNLAAEIEKQAAADAADAIAKAQA